MSYPPDDSWYRQMVEQQLIFDKYFKPIEDVQKQYEQIYRDHLGLDNPIQQQFIDLVGDLNNQKQLIEKGLFNKSLIEDKLLEDSLRQREIYMRDFGLPDYQKQLLEQHFIEAPIIDESMHRQILSMQEDMKRHFGSIESMARELQTFNQFTGFESVMAAQEEFYRFQAQNQDLMGLINPPSSRVEYMLASAEAKLRVLGPDDVFADLTLSSVAEYQAFVDRQYKSLEHDEDIIAIRRVEVTELSGDLFENVNSALNIGLTLDKSIDNQEGEVESHEVSSGGIYGCINQHIGVVYSNRFHGNVKSSFSNSAPVRISKLGRKITEHVYTINEICKRSDRNTIFKPTNKTMRAFSIIPSLIAKNERDFNHLVDQLYFVLYEGSGSAKRLDAKKHDQLLAPLWKIKHFRLAARHDVDHGKEKEIEQKNTNIGEAFFSLIQQKMPIKTSDWIKTQFNLYTEINYMLQGFIQELVKN